MRDFKPAVKEILSTLMTEAKSLDYDRNQVEKAIIKCRGIDPRTVKVWFNILWKFEYFTQPRKGLYRINLEKLSELELVVPSEIIDPKQRRLSP